MFSDPSSVREAFEYPDEQNPQNIQEQAKVKKEKSDDHVMYKNDDKKREKQKKKFYFKMKVFGKMAKFINNLQSSATMNEPKFKESEINYIHAGQEIEQTYVSIKYENKLFYICQILSFLTSLIILWKATFEIVLGRLGREQDFEYLECIGLILCLVMIMFNLNTEMKDEKMGLIKIKTKIRESYLEGQFVYDVLAMVGLVLILTPLDEMFQEVYYCARILLLCLLKQNENNFEIIINRINMNREMESAVYIVKLGMKVLKFLHVLSLVLIAFSFMEKGLGVEKTWVESNGFGGARNYELYIYAWYWGCTIMSTVGFGDINPTSGNVLESLLVSVLELVCTVLFSYFVNYIGELLRIFGESKVAYEQDIRRLNNYLKNLRVEDGLRDQARTHLFNKYRTLELFDKGEEERVRAQLTDGLREALFLANNRSILSESPLVRHFSEQAVHDLAAELAKEVYPPEEWVFSEGSQDVGLVIVEDGQIAEVAAKHLLGKPLSVSSRSNKTLGWINFLTGQAYHSSAWSNVFTIAYRLPRQAFLRVLKGLPQDFFRFYELRDYLIERAQLFENSCLGCGKLSHNVINCPRLHFTPKKIQYILSRKRKTAEFRGDNLRKPTFRRNDRQDYWFQHVEVLEGTLKKSLKKSVRKPKKTILSASSSEESKEKHEQKQQFFSIIRNLVSNFNTTPDIPQEQESFQPASISFQKMKQFYQVRTAAKELTKPEFFIDLFFSDENGYYKPEAQVDKITKQASKVK